jgi:hypothetical protein
LAGAFFFSVGVGFSFFGTAVPLILKVRVGTISIVAMTGHVEYLFAASFYVADQAARERGWHPSGRTTWLKADGTMVCFICLEEQLAEVPAGATVHRIGC